MQWMGKIGIVAFLLGLALLWHNRQGIRDWLKFYLGTLRAEVYRRGGLESAELEPSTGRRPRAETALPLIGGFGLVLLGQILFLLELAF